MFTEAGPFLAAQLQRQSSRNFARDRVLNREDIQKLFVELLSPQSLSLLYANESHPDPDPVAGFLDTAIQHSIYH